MSESGRSTGSGQAHDDGAIADPLASRVRHALSSWLRWRRTRPFWGGLLVLLGAAEILLSERGPLPLVVHIGVQGLAGYLVPLIMLLCGLLLWFNPVQRMFYSLLAVMLALASWVTSNLGGFFIGMLLGLIGGALAFAWTSTSEQAPVWRRFRLPGRREPSAGLDLVLRDSGDETAPDDAAPDDAAPGDAAPETADDTIPDVAPEPAADPETDEHDDDPWPFGHAAEADSGLLRGRPWLVRSLAGSLSAVPIALAMLPLVLHVGVRGLAGYLVPLIMLLCSLLLWFSPLQRMFYSLLAVMVALASWGASQLGGFCAGMLLGGVAGAALVFAWTAAAWRRPAWRRLLARRRGEAGSGLLRGRPWLVRSLAGSLSAVPIALAMLPLVLHVGVRGLAGYLVPLIMLLCSLLLWFSPLQRMFYSLLAVMVALASWGASQLGGFCAGMLLGGVAGAALVFAWTAAAWRRPAWRRLLRPRRAEPSDLILRGSGDDADARPGPAVAGTGQPGPAAGTASSLPRDHPSLVRALSAVPIALAMLASETQQGRPQNSVPQEPPITCPAASLAPGLAVTRASLLVPTLSPARAATLAATVADSSRPGAQHSAGPPALMTSRLRLRPHVQYEPLRGPAPAADAGSLATAAVSVTGLTFAGITQVQTAQGMMPMLKFTMSSLTLSGGTSLTFGPAGHSMVTHATSLALSGHVVLYATKICGDMDGVPVTFTPQHPPGRLDPGITFTNLRAEQPFASADSFAGSELGITGEPAG